VLKLLKYRTALDLIFIALSSDLRFHVLYGEISIGSHNSINAAIQSIANERIYGVSDDAKDWERLMPLTLEAVCPMELHKLILGTIIAVLIALCVLAALYCAVMWR